MGEKILIVSFFSIFIIIGACISIPVLRGIFKSHRMQNWPSVTAHIKMVDLVIYPDTNGGGSSEVKVEYEYEAEGKVRRGTQIHPAYTASGFEGHRALHEKLSRAQTVRVFYNPQDPDDAYIVKGSYSSNLAALFGGLLFFFVGLLFMIAVWFGVSGKSNYENGLEVLEYKSK